jgi:hypothetical protein
MYFPLELLVLFDWEREGGTRDENVYESLDVVWGVNAEGTYSGFYLSSDLLFLLRLYPLRFTRLLLSEFLPI